VAEVARRIGVSRQTVMRWQRKLESGGLAQMARVGVLGRGRPFNVQIKELGGLPKAGSIAAGFANELWTLQRIGTSLWAGGCSDQRAIARARREGDPV
jgi:transposase